MMRGSSKPRAAARTQSAGAGLQLRRILVPIDFSAPSGQALGWALALAQACGAQITLLHVVPEIGPATLLTSDLPALQNELKQAAERKLAGWLREGSPTGVRIRKMLRVGVPAEQVRLVAKMWPADLILLATHGHGGLKHALLGGTTETIVRHAPCPVLVVRGPVRKTRAGPSEPETKATGRPGKKGNL